MNDIRAFKAINEMKKTDTSFTEKGFLGLPIKYKQHEVREIWFRGIELGLESGLQMGSLEGQRIETQNNFKNKKQKEFYEKFLKLSEEYKCAIQYHPELGMCVIDRESNNI